MKDDDIRKCLSWFQEMASLDMPADRRFEIHDDCYYLWIRAMRPYTREDFVEGAEYYLMERTDTYSPNIGTIKKYCEARRTERLRSRQFTLPDDVIYAKPATREFVTEQVDKIKKVIGGRNENR